MQVDALMQYAYAEPAQQHAVWPSTALRPSAEQALSPEAQQHPRGLDAPAAAPTYGSPATSAHQAERSTLLSSTLAEKHGSQQACSQIC